MSIATIGISPMIYTATISRIIPRLELIRSAYQDQRSPLLKLVRVMANNRIAITRMWTPNILPAVNKIQSAVLGLAETKALQLCPVNDSKPLLNITSGINVKTRPKSKTAKFGTNIIFQAILTDRDFKFPSPPLPLDLFRNKR